jgi:ubiquinone/menaquinone biosynthesis C-methylase UbiE
MRQLPFWKWNHARILLNFRENGMNRCLLMTRAERLFSTIAPIYDLILSPTLTCLYRKAVAQAIKLVPSLNPNGNGTPGSQKSLNMTALDVGTGTGLLAAALTERGFTVFGIDVSANMLTTARRRRPHAAKFARAPAHCSSMQSGAPFDLVCAGMLMHGLPRSYRQQVLKNMALAAKRAVLIVDFSPSYRLLTAIVERLEGSFYRDFITEFPEDLSLCYGHTNVLTHPLNGSCSLYIGCP